MQRACTRGIARPWVFYMDPWVFLGFSDQPRSSQASCLGLWAWMLLWMGVDCGYGGDRRRASGQWTSGYSPLPGVRPGLNCRGGELGGNVLGKTPRRSLNLMLSASSR